MAISKKDLEIVGSGCKERIPDSMLPKVAKLLRYKWKVAGRNKLNVTQEGTTFSEVIPVRYGTLWDHHVWVIYVGFQHVYAGPKKSITLGYIHEDDLESLGVTSICDEKINLANVRSWRPKCIKGRAFENELLKDPKTQKLIRELSEEK